jgi:hypothetical protein
MLEKLKTKWKVTTTQLVIILCTFAIGGSLCGYLGKRILGLFAIESKPLYVVAYIVMITLLWPLCVIGVSIPFGQFPFFSNYLKKVKNRMFGKK